MLTILLQIPNPQTGNHVADLLLRLMPLYTPILVPLIVSVLKRYVTDYVPKLYFPLITPALGVALDYIRALSTGVSTDPLLAAVLGALGVFVYEVVDQIHKYLKADAPPAE